MKLAIFYCQVPSEEHHAFCTISTKDNAMKKTNNTVLSWKQLTHRLPLKDLRDAEGVEGIHFENHWPREKRLTVAMER